MNAGYSRIPLGERIEVVRVQSSDPDERLIEGVQGDATHPFASGGYPVIGIFVERGGDPMQTINLLYGDEVKIVATGEIITL
jgi:hypothetical protein